MTFRYFIQYVGVKTGLTDIVKIFEVVNALK